MADLACAVIDGTGAWNDGTYESEMRNSFCHQIVTGLGADQCRYERGPSFEGYRMNERGERAAEFVAGKLKRGSARVVLAGYSRGAVAAIMAAEYLQSRGLPVDAMFLFDPVERHLSSGGRMIASNVKKVYVALRDFNNKQFDAYDHTIGVGPVAHNPVRQFFGTAVMSFAPQVIVRKRMFLGSHGALGGVGWKHVRFDGHCQMEVAAFINAGLAAERIPVTLVSKPPCN